MYDMFLCVMCDVHVIYVCVMHVCIMFMCILYVHDCVMSVRCECDLYVYNVCVMCV